MPRNRKHLEINLAAWRAARVSKNLTPEQLAPLLGVSLATVRGYECGSRTPFMDTAIKAADVLGKPFNELFREVGGKATQ